MAITEKYQYAAIIPAAGKGSRLSPLPCSKELVPVGLNSTVGGKSFPKPVISYLIKSIYQSGVSGIHLVLREGKMDIPAYLKSGDNFGVKISYHLTESDRGVPFTINEAYPFYKDKNILFGFPDILFSPVSALKILKDRLEKSDNADLLLGLFPVSEQLKWDTVIVDNKNQVKQIRIKEPFDKKVKYAWIIAAWRPAFSAFLHKAINQYHSTGLDTGKEVQLGDLIQMAIHSGFKVFGVPFDQGECLDIGTMEGYAKSGPFINEFLNN
ncbi:MAG: hypothetical protein K8S16_07470 [Bacteroidales bacterium]|nr:hypothetical protein [Bacteroidales bacterium]